MTPHRLARLKEVFHDATARPPEERDAFLDAACAGDAELREEAAALVAAWEPEDESLAAGVSAAAARLAREPPRPVRIGPYRVIGELGEGGMGVVYLAERDDDVYRKRVAIKVFRGLGLKEEARFLTERRILGRLEHPGIARLMDGGTTESGRPYIVMEHVEGEPIDAYCDGRRMTTEARVALFRRVCLAVHYAHQNLVVHRDLKPSNILVTPSGEPKLLDFGIAKLLEPPPPEATPLTDTGLRPMTPDYASPEQIRGEAITTASDVYSLGVVLYELLTGRRPFRRQGRFAERIEPLVADVAPERPSSAVARAARRATEGAATEVGRARQTTPARLRRRLGGDLDNIVLKALEKEPSRRYASALQLSEDLRRHLDGEPVLARRPTWSYVGGKFVRRHRVAVAIAAAFALIVVGFVTSQTRLVSRLRAEREIARQESQTARRESDFLQDIFRAAGPNGDSVTARELLDRGAEHVRAELQDEPEAEATLLDTLGSVYGNLGLPGRAVPLLEDALRIRSATFGSESAEAAASLEVLGSAERERGRYAQAEALLRRSLAIRERRTKAPSAEVAASLHALGVVLYDERRDTEAEALLRRALAIREGRADRKAGAAETLERLAQVLEDQARLAEARTLAERAVAAYRGLGSVYDNGLAGALDRLASVQRESGALAAAEAAAREALRLRRTLLGPEHPLVAASLDRLATVRLARGDRAQAEALDRRALALLQRVPGEALPEVAGVELNLAQALDDGDAPAESVALVRSAVAAREARLGADHPLTLRARERQWRLVEERGELGEAEAGFRDVLAARRTALPARHLDVAESLVDLGTLLERRGRPSEAVPLLREALSILREGLPAGHRRIAEAEAALARCLTPRSRPPETGPTA